MKNAEKIDHFIKYELQKNNLDNVSRTLAYQQFYNHVPEIKWAYLANMVSRNAGWSMSDLLHDAMVQLLDDEWRRRLFTTYERANWLIFSDAYPQLLIYKLSHEANSGLFDHLKRWNVSKWMINEWWIFWSEKDEERLLKALIINEQNTIEKPVLKAPFFKKKVFGQFLYKVQDFNHNNIVVFPSSEGELYGAASSHFTKVVKRVEIGYKLSWILFESNAKESIYSYYKNSTYVGCRSIDIPIHMFQNDHSLPLRSVFPIIYHHDEVREDWSLKHYHQSNILLSKKVHPPKNNHLTKWFERKRKHLFMIGKFASFFDKK
ncbi:DUF2515 family protein [Salipaludibacillus sp. CF4.18]|uniref:DUF2515 family protein n=1 Tax=Salipaludibacillus sp. CF4.18 TaxID=3373081 RepID=UPI003EE5A1CF